jgi:UDP-glucose 4-epimerase
VYKHLYGLNYAVLRYPNVYGPRQDPHGEAGVVAIFTGLMLRGQPVTINGTGEQERDFVYVGDCARANILAAMGDQTGIYNVGEERGTTINQIFQELAKITNYTLAPNYGPPKAGETFKIYLDSQKIQKELGWEQTVDLATGLRKTVEYFGEFEGA